MAKLARETVIAVTIPSAPKTFDSVLGREGFYLTPSAETAQCLRLKLIRALELYRCAFTLKFVINLTNRDGFSSRTSGFNYPEVVLGNVFAVCAEAISTCIEYCAQGDACMHILETVYYATIFILRSIHALAEFAKVTANRHIFLVVRTIACWTDAMVFRCLYAFDYRSTKFDEDLLKAYMAFRSVVLVYVSVIYSLLIR